MAPTKHSGDKIKREKTFTLRRAINRALKKHCTGGLRQDCRAAGMESVVRRMKDGCNAQADVQVCMF